MNEVVSYWTGVVFCEEGMPTSWNHEQHMETRRTEDRVNVSLLIYFAVSTFFASSVFVSMKINIRKQRSKCRWCSEKLKNT